MPIVSQTFDALIDCNDDFILYSSRFGGDNEAHVSENAQGGYWCWTNAGSASSGTGPPTGTACMHAETSSPSAVGDIFYAELRVAINALTQDIHTVTFQTCMQGTTAGYMYFEAYNGSTWDIIDSWPGDAVTTFTARGPYDFGPGDLDYTNTDFQVRFRIVTAATSYQNDFAIDTFYLEYDVKDVSEVEQEGFRFYEDGTEAGSTPHEDQDVDLTIGQETTFQERVLLDATGDPATAQYQLEYKENGDGAGEWRKVPLT